VITLLSGNPGHGKSYSAVKLIDDSVGKGIPVATNVPLREDWATVIAKRRTIFGRWRPQTVAAKAEEYSKLVHVTKDLSELLRVRFAGRGEGRARVIIDEAHREMNTRAWDQSPGLSREESIAVRLKVVAYISGHRHYGADVWLITQAIANLDSQVRGLFEFHTEVRNMRRLPLFGLLFRFNLFLATTTWNDRSKTKAGVTMYGLSKSLARLYDTHALQEDDWPADAIVLPHGSANPSSGAGRDGGASGQASGEAPEAGQASAASWPPPPPRTLPSPRSARPAPLTDTGDAFYVPAPEERTGA
jgi:Zonular occludens toxin (Zot)